MHIRLEFVKFGLQTARFGNLQYCGMIDVTMNTRGNNLKFKMEAKLGPFDSNKLGGSDLVLGTGR